MKINRTIEFGYIDDNIKHSEFTKHLTGEERISLLEELRYDLGEFIGVDYSQRFERVLLVIDKNK